MQLIKFACIENRETVRNGRKAGNRFYPVICLRPKRLSILMRDVAQACWRLNAHGAVRMWLRLIFPPPRRKKNACRSSGAGKVTITWLAGDMADASLGHFDYVIAMDSVIHYPLDVIADLIEGWAERTKRAVIVTYAPSNPLLLTMKAVGKIFPRQDRSPRINPISEKRLSEALHACLGDQIMLGRTERVSTGFYKSQALEVMRK